MQTTDVTNAADMKYPGGKMVAAAKVEASVEGEGTYDFTYKVNVNVDLKNILENSPSTFKVTLYRANDTAISGDLVSGCKVSETSGNDGLHYSYDSSCKLNSDLGTTATKVGDEQTITSATMVEGNTKAFGHDGGYTITFEDEKIESVTSTSEKNVYYYAVLEYVELEDSQNTDMGKEVSIKLAGVSDGTVATHQVTP